MVALKIITLCGLCDVKHFALQSLPLTLSWLHTDSYPLYL